MSELKQLVESTQEVLTEEVLNEEVNSIMSSIQELNEAFNDGDITEDQYYELLEVDLKGMAQKLNPFKGKGVASGQVKDTTISGKKQMKQVRGAESDNNAAMAMAERAYKSVLKRTGDEKQAQEAKQKVLDKYKTSYKFAS
jgi:hypothetical protein